MSGLLAPINERSPIDSQGPYELGKARGMRASGRGAGRANGIAGYVGNCFDIAIGS
jgi:hypothetical protein